jgi:hypothetical protein
MLGGRRGVPDTASKNVQLIPAGVLTPCVSLPAQKIHQNIYE